MRKTFSHTDTQVTQDVVGDDPSFDNVEENNLVKHFYDLNTDNVLLYVSRKLNSHLCTLYVALSFQFNGFWKFNFPLKHLIRQDDDTRDGLKVRIEAAVGDTSGDVHHGWSTVDLIKPVININFIGPQDKIIDTDLGFSTMVRYTQF